MHEMSALALSICLLTIGEHSEHTALTVPIIPSKASLNVWESSSHPPHSRPSPMVYHQVVHVCSWIIVTVCLQATSYDYVT